MKTILTATAIVRDTPTGDDQGQVFLRRDFGGWTSTPRVGEMVEIVAGLEVEVKALRWSAQPDPVVQIVLKPLILVPSELAAVEAAGWLRA